MKPKTEQPPNKICVVLCYQFHRPKDENDVVAVGGGGGGGGGGGVGEEYIRHI
jgi:hypothetical protein